MNNEKLLFWFLRWLPFFDGLPNTYCQLYVDLYLYVENKFIQKIEKRTTSISTEHLIII